MGEEIELDVIALCCDYSVDTVEDIAANIPSNAEERAKTCAMPCSTT